MDSAFCDKFIWSLSDSGIQRKLLDESFTKTFSEICTIALTMEMVANNVDEMQEHRRQLEDDSKRVDKTFNKYARGAHSSNDYKNLRVSRRADSGKTSGYIRIGEDFRKKGRMSGAIAVKSLDTSAEIVMDGGSHTIDPGTISVLKESESY